MRKSTLNVRGKNLLWIGLTLIVSIVIVGATILSMVMVPVSVSADEHAAASIWVDPGSYLTAPELDNLTESDTFTVNVMVNVTAANCVGTDGIPGTPDDGTGLYGWDYHLKWDATNLNLTSYTINIPPEWGANWFKPKDLIGDYNATHKYHWFAVSALAPAPPLNETTTTMPIMVCTYNFQVIETIYQPSPDEIGKIDLQDTKLSDDTGEPIPHTAYDALYRKRAQPVPPPELAVKPAKVHGVWSEKFNITIEIRFLNATLNMSRWDATLSYNTTMLDAQASFEGPFLPGFGGTNYTYTINDTLGTVYTTGFFLSPPATPPNGTGVLAIIEFNATWQYTVSSTRIPPISCKLSLSNTKLVNWANLTISTLPPRNATYNAPYKPQVIDHPIVVDGVTYHVFTESNSSVSPVPMILDQSNKSLSFSVTGKSGYYGFCNVTIPKNFLRANPPTDPWEVMVGGAVQSYTITENATHTVLKITYQLPSTLTVRIKGAWVVPEFPIAMILPLLLIATLTAAILGKKVRPGKRRGPSVAE